MDPGLEGVQEVGTSKSTLNQGIEEGSEDGRVRGMGQRLLSSLLVAHEEGEARKKDTGKWQAEHVAVAGFGLKFREFRNSEIHSVQAVRKSSIHHGRSTISRLLR